LFLKLKSHLSAEARRLDAAPFAGARLHFLCLALIATAAPTPLALAHGDLHEQITALAEAIAKDANNPELYLRRAELNRLHGDWAAAQRDIDRARELAPDLPVIDLALGRLLLDTKRFTGAEEALDRFLIRTPGHVEGLITRGRARMGAGEHSAAADDFGRAIERAQTPEPEYYIDQAHAFSAAGPEHIPEALAALDRGMTKLGKLVTLGLYAVELECARKNFDAALERLDALSATQPRKEAWCERRGDVLDAAGRSDEAKAAYQAGLEAIKSLPPHIQSTAAVQQRQERLERKLKEIGPAAAQSR